jgi:RNA polymerase-associated protein CTR9
MGKACIMYMRKDYKASLEYFKKCLQASPNCPAFIRLGIGYCLVKLGKTDKAKWAPELKLFLFTFQF